MKFENKRVAKATREKEYIRRCYLPRRLIITESMTVMRFPGGIWNRQLRWIWFILAT